MKHQLKTAKHENEELKNSKTSSRSSCRRKAAQQQALCKLQTELDFAKKERKSHEAERAGLEKEKSDAVAAMNATQTNDDGLPQTA